MPAQAVTLCALLSLTGSAAPLQLKSDSKIVDQPEAPVQITTFVSVYQRRTNDSLEGIRHDVEYRSRATQKIVAIQFGLVSFDVWNQFLAYTAGLSTEEVNPKARKRNEWLTPSDAATGFLTGVVYVDRVRFESGEIWIADKEQILTAMRAIQKDFDPANLGAVPRK
jgi:hypothetical protein